MQEKDKIIIRGASEHNLEKIIHQKMSQFPNIPVLFAIEASDEYWKPLWHYFTQRSFEAIYVPS